MSRVGKMQIVLPKTVQVGVSEACIVVKGENGQLTQALDGMVRVVSDSGVLKFEPVDGTKRANAMSGTVRALVNNMVVGVTKGFEKKLALVGVGFKAQSQGKMLNLALGFSHPVVYEMPDGVSCSTPAATEIIIKGADRQQVGQVAAEIRAYRPPEPYKGKGVRYLDEKVLLKETKKK